MTTMTYPIDLTGAAGVSDTASAAAVLPEDPSSGSAAVVLVEALGRRILNVGRNLALKQLSKLK